MSNTVYFVSGNKGKFLELQKFNESFGIDLKLTELELLEPQSMSLTYISKFKATHAWKKIKKPLIVDDGGIFFENYNNFPGTMSKYIAHGLGIDGIMKLIEPGTKAKLRTVITYKEDEEHSYSFEGICEGKMFIPDNIKDNDTLLPYSSTFYPDGYDENLITLRKNEILGPYHHRYQAFSKFAQWYLSK